MQSLHARPAGAGVVLKTPDGKALCVKATYKDYWTFAGGKIDDNEHPKQTAIREAEEEAGIKIDDSSVSFALVVSQLVDDIYSYYFLYEAQISNEDVAGITIPEGEIAEWSMVDLDVIEQDERMFSVLVQLYAKGQRGYGEFELSRI